MGIQEFLRLFVAALAGGLFLSAAGPAHALMVPYTAAPSCDISGNCFATLNGPVPDPGTTSGFTIEIDLDFPFHIELFDSDVATEDITFIITATNNSSNFINLDTELRFTDEFGQVIQDQGQDVVLTRTVFFSGLMTSFFGSLNFPVDFPLDQIIFHDLIFTATATNQLGGAPVDLEFSPLTQVSFLRFDTTSNVGLWPHDMPTPGTLALMGAGLIGLGLLHRRRRRLN